MEDPTKENIAATLARVLPTAQVIQTTLASGESDDLLHIAVPKNFELREIDTEKLMDHPRRTKALATINDADSFIAYVNEHAQAGTKVWCSFNPQTFALQFTAVIDEHSKADAGWRGHKATFSPAVSLEWQTWTGSNKQPKSQVDFAEFLEANENDIAAVDGMPSSLDMHKLATEFVARQDLSIKSIVRTQNQGVQLQYINDADAGTTEAMKVFEKFAIGIPVFWTAPEAGETPKPIEAFRLDARLKYKLGNGKVSFHYELIRPDRVHQKAAVELIERIRVAVVNVPLLMGNCA